MGRWDSFGFLGGLGFDRCHDCVTVQMRPQKRDWKQAVKSSLICAGGMWKSDPSQIRNRMEQMSKSFLQKEFRAT